MYLLPWHSLSKTGSHLSTSIRWYSIGQPLSLAMIISDVTSCPEIVPYAALMKIIPEVPLLSRKWIATRDRFSKDRFIFFLFFSLLWPLPSTKVSPRTPIDTDGIQEADTVFTFHLFFREATALSFVPVPTINARFLGRNRGREVEHVSFELPGEPVLSDFEFFNLMWLKFSGFFNLVLIRILISFFFLIWFSLVFWIPLFSLRVISKYL